MLLVRHTDNESNILPCKHHFQTPRHSPISAAHCNTHTQTPTHLQLRLECRPMSQRSPQCVQSARLHKVGRLHCGHSAESVAYVALPLIFHLRHCPTLPPVYVRCLSNAHVCKRSALMTPASAFVSHLGRKRASRRRGLRQQTLPAEQTPRPPNQHAH
jgi:hypothetical protein